MSISELQKYQWTVTGLRPTENEFGSMYYYRGNETDALVRKLRTNIADLEKELASLRREYNRTLT